MFLVAVVVLIVLMMAWVGLGYVSRDPARPYGLGNTIVPWLCVLIVALVAFGVIPGSGPAVVVPVQRVG